MSRTSSHPPRWANRFLRWFCDEQLLESIEGDLYELYQDHRKTHGKVRADWLFVRDVFSFFKPFAFEKYSRAKQFIPMLDNYLKIALRNIWHRKGFTAINMLGLTVGATAIVLISVYLNYELSYDKTTPAADQIYRLHNTYREQVYTNMQFLSYNNSSDEEQLNLIRHLKEQEGIEEAAHFVTTGSEIGSGALFVKIGEEEHTIENLLQTNTGQAFQDIFPQRFLLGDPAGALAQKNSIVLIEKLASKWFGPNWQQRRLLGKTLEIAGDLFTLTGVVAQVPGNTHYSFEAIVQQDQIPSWGAYTYLKKSTQADIDDLLGALNQSVEQIYPNYYADGLAKGISAVSLTDIHFTNDTLYELKATANLTYLRTFAWVGAILLLIILINYTNLSVAMYADRQRELGMRKVLGARAKDVSMQLFVEAIGLAILCFPLVLLMVWGVFSKFNDLMGMELTHEQVFGPSYLLLLLFGLLFTGFLSGMYPAIIYGQRSTLSLFGKQLTKLSSLRSFNLRNGLLGLQFFCLVGLLSMTSFIYQQMRYVQTADLGYQKENIIYFNIDGAEKYQQLKTVLQAIPEVASVGGGGVPGANMFNQTTYKLAQTTEVFADATEQYLGMGALETLGISCPNCPALLAGKEQVFLLNRTAAERLAQANNTTPEALIGEILITEPEYENEVYGFGIHHPIDGIIEDYHYFSLKYEHQPLLLTVYQQPPWVYEALVRVETEDFSATIRTIEAAYQTVETTRPFAPKFLKDRLDKLYQTEQLSGTLLAWLCGIAIVLAMMGLAGVVAYLTYQRRKEISIRKVLGASNSGILLQFNKEFMFLLLAAVILALPLTLYFGSVWLSAFAFRINPQPLVVALAGAGILVLVVTVVSIYAWQVARRAPMKSLRVNGG